jgi:nucleotide-binding universal stress UspA family protein
MSKKRVLVPIGFSDYSMELLKYAAQLCNRMDGELHILHGLEIPLSIRNYCTEEQKKEIDAFLENSIATMKSEIEKTYNFPIITCIKEGRVYESVLDYQKDEKVDWLIIGANGSDHKIDFIGANTLRILRESPCPTISLKGDCEKQAFNSIIVPLDLTNEVNEKLRRTTNIAKQFPDATIRLISVSTSNDEFVINRISRHMGHLKGILIEDGISASSEIITGVKSKAEIPTTILDYTRKTDGDLILIMTQKEAIPVKYFIGSIAQQIINQDEFPVLSIVP